MSETAFAKKTFWTVQEYTLSNVQENIELIFYSLLAFFIPFVMGHPQLLVGIIVNAAIVLAALNMKGYKLLPVILLPSVAVLSRGLIFGPFTMFLIYLIPFIWAGNFILLYAYRELKLKRKMNSIMTIIIGAGAKTAFLFGIAFILVQLEIIPIIFLSTMGLLQLYTALAGGTLALGIHETKKYLTKKTASP
jgi:hypothetical protein